MERNILILLFLFCFACKKSSIPYPTNQSCTMPPSPVRFVVLDKNGKNLISSKGDLVTISFLENGVEKILTSIIFKIKDSNYDTTTSNKYNGLGVGSPLGDYSVRNTNPIKTFNLNINGKKIGIIYYDLIRTNWEQDCYSEKSYLFNGVDVKKDKSVIPDVSILQLM